MIRPILPSDLSETVTVLESVKHKMITHGINQWDATYPNITTIQSDIQKKQAYIYTENEKILAYMVLNEEYDIEYDDLAWSTPPPFLVLHRLFVSPHAQGKGIARKMLEYMENYASANQYKSIRLDTYSLNPTANALYLNKGYKLVGTVTFRKGIFNCYEKAIEY